MCNTGKLKDSVRTGGWQDSRITRKSPGKQEERYQVETLIIKMFVYPRYHFCCCFGYLAGLKSNETVFVISFLPSVSCDSEGKEPILPSFMYKGLTYVPPQHTFIWGCFFVPGSALL